MNSKLKLSIILSVIGMFSLAAIWANKGMEDKSNLTMLNIEALSSSEVTGYAYQETDTVFIWDTVNEEWIVSYVCSCYGEGDLDCSNYSC